MKTTKIQYVLKFQFKNDTSPPRIFASYDDLSAAITAYHQRKAWMPLNTYYVVKTLTEVYESECILEIPDTPVLKSSITFRTCPNPEIIVVNAATQEALDWIAQNTHFLNEELYYEKESRQTLRKDFHLHVNPNYDFEEVLKHLATFPGAQVIRHVVTPYNVQSVFSDFLKR